MNRIKLPVLAAVALVIAGCQTAKQLARDEQVSIFRPELWLKDDALYYAAGADEPYTGKHEAWYVNGDKAWEGEMIKGKRHGQYTQWYPENGGRHVAGLYKGGSRDGAWGQWYPTARRKFSLSTSRAPSRRLLFTPKAATSYPRKFIGRKFGRGSTGKLGGATVSRTGGVTPANTTHRITTAPTAGRLPAAARRVTSAT